MYEITIFPVEKHFFHVFFSGRKIAFSSIKFVLSGQKTFYYVNSKDILSD